MIGVDIDKLVKRLQEAKKAERKKMLNEIENVETANPRVYVYRSVKKTILAGIQQDVYVARFSTLTNDFDLKKQGFQRQSTRNNIFCYVLGLKQKVNNTLNLDWSKAQRFQFNIHTKAEYDKLLGWYNQQIVAKRIVSDFYTV